MRTFCDARGNVCFTPESGRLSVKLECPPRGMSGHLGLSSGMTARLGHAIPNSGLGQNDPRIVWVLFNLLPQLADIDAQILRILDMRGAPHRSENLPVRYHAPSVLCQER